MEKIIELIKKYINDKLYGKIVIIFESGKIVHVEKTESIKI